MTLIPGRYTRIDKSAAMIVEPRTTFILWTPSQLSPVAWWDMSVEENITESLGKVSQVDDRSGNNRHLTQANGSYQPDTWTRSINGLNVVEFDESNWLENLAAASAIFPTSTKINVFAIASRDVSNSEDMFFYVNSNPTPGVTTTDPTWDGLGNGNQDALEAVMMLDDFQNQCRTTYQDAPDWFSESGPTSQYQAAEGGDVPIFIAKFDRGIGSSRRFGQYINSEFDDEEITAQNANIATTIVVGGHGSLGSASRKLNGVVGEIFITHGDLSDADRYKAEGYFAHKWGLTENLPFGHKYKQSPPRVL